MGESLRCVLTVAALLTIGVGSPGVALAAVPADSVRLARAKDYIADEQWPRAIAELRAAIADPREKAKDEALYWLAQSLSQSGDSAAALETILELERQYPASMWVKPAGQLRLEIAIRLHREDVLFWMATPPPPPPARAPRAVPPAPAAGRTPPAPPPVPPTEALPAVPPPATIWAPATPMPPTPPPRMWLPEGYRPDLDIQIQALGRLIRTNAQIAIPRLKDIALAGEESEARRAVFVLLQSGRPDARDTVLQVARTGREPVRIAAVREMGRLGGPEISKDLLQVYTTADLPVKLQVLTSLGERLERGALLRIAESEKDLNLRENAIVTLGQAGGGEQLRLLYRQAEFTIKLPIIAALFTAREEDELIRIAQHERDPRLRNEAIRQLRQMDSAKAREYLKNLQKTNRK